MTEQVMIGAAFIGGKRFFVGVPARDLTLDEWDKLPKKLQRKLIRLGLYEVKYG